MCKEAGRWDLRKCTFGIFRRSIEEKEAGYYFMVGLFNVTFDNFTNGKHRHHKILQSGVFYKASNTAHNPKKSRVFSKAEITKFLLEGKIAKFLI